MTVVLIFAESEFEHAVTLANPAEAAAFCSGLSTGADLYGAGGCVGYAMPHDHTEMIENEEASEVYRATEAWKELQP